MDDDFVRIDKEDLDTALLEQPMLCWDWHKAFAFAQEKMERLKLKMDVVKAEVDLEIRSAPAHFGLEKVTDPTIKAAVTVDKRCIKAEKEYLRAKRDFTLLKGGTKSLEDRKVSLQNLVKLFEDGYFSSSNIVPKDKVETITKGKARETLKELNEIMEKRRKSGK